MNSSSEIDSKQQLNFSSSLFQKPLYLAKRAETFLKSAHDLRTLDLTEE